MPLRAASLVVALGAILMGASLHGAEFMFRALVDDTWLEGQPLSWTSTSMVLLARDGQLHTFDPRRAEQASKTAPSFSGYSVGELRQHLYAEFGSSFDFSSTEHYLVVHPVQQADVWAPRFEQLYRDFVRWARVRGFATNDPAFPLVAVVLPSEQQYLQYARSQGKQLAPGTLGHYDPRTNRVYLFDASGGVTSPDWADNAATLVHEATHQTAYNVGVHSRVAATPRWVVEGLATLFEARSVYRAEARDTIADRLNQGRLSAWRDQSTTRPVGRMANLVVDDEFFHRQADIGYAEAWALTLYLSETRPREYATYLEASGSQIDNTPAARVADFAAAFGEDLELLEANFVRWMEELP